MRRARCGWPRADAAPQRGLPVVRAWRAAPRAPSRAASRGARPGISRRCRPARWPATRPCAGRRRRASRKRASAGGGPRCSSRSTCQRRVSGARRSAVGRRAEVGSSARSTNSPGVRKRRLAQMPSRSASACCSQRRIENCGTSTMSGRSQSPSAGSARDFRRQQAGQHVQRIGVVEAEVGRVRASRHHAGARSQLPRRKRIAGAPPYRSRSATMPRRAYAGIQPLHSHPARVLSARPRPFCRSARDRLPTRPPCA